MNDTRHLSKVAREYLTLICPQATRVIPGRMTAMLRGKFGLNDVLGLNGEKNRNDHRHHAVDACVIAVTDQGMLKKFADASASAREKHLNRLVESMPLPWDSYREHVQRAIENIWVSHKPDHAYEGVMHEDTAYRPPHLDKQGMWKTRGIGGNNSNEKKGDSDAMVAINHTSNSTRHTTDEHGKPIPYKGYVGGNNYCIEIIRNEKGKWEGEVISTFKAYQYAKALGKDRLCHPHLSVSNKPLIMRLMKNDVVRMDVNGKIQNMLVIKIPSNGQVFMAGIREANSDARNKDTHDSFAYISKTAGTLQKASARRITISPIGELRDPGFKE